MQTHHHKKAIAPPVILLLPGCVQLGQFGVAEIGLRETGIQVRNFEIHGSLSQKISAFFLPGKVKIINKIAYTMKLL